MARKTKFKTKFRDYFIGPDFGAPAIDYDYFYDLLWNRIMKEYPDKPEMWDKIYEAARDDFDYNYTGRVVFKRKI